MANVVSLVTIARRVRAEMAAQQKTQVELARELGMTPVSLSRRMQGYVDFTATELARVARFLDVPVETLLADETNGDRVAS
jgi:transcriptional regulator with XRE-family HTH domain